MEIIQFRLNDLSNERYKSLLLHWFNDSAKARRRERKSPPASAQHQTRKAEKAAADIRSFSISRGLRNIEGNGIADASDAGIKQQMKDKHPPAAIGTVWPELPPEWLQMVEIDLSDLPEVLHKADPKTGVGIRGVRPSHLDAVFQGKFNDPGAIAAPSNFTELGALYLKKGLAPWVRRILGGGLLTPLNKHAPPTNDARPVKAEDFDTSSWCQAFARKIAPIVVGHIGPQQLGIGVPGGIELYIHGLKIKFELAVRDGVEVVLVTIDVNNAHNSTPRALAQKNLIDRARADSRLIPLAVAGESTLRAHNPIYMRSSENASGFTYLCDSESGGGQGNALTGIIYAANQDPALKATEAAFPEVEVKAVHDEITLLGPPADIWGDGGALGPRVSCGPTEESQPHCQPE